LQTVFPDSVKKCFYIAFPYCQKLSFRFAFDRFGIIGDFAAETAQPDFYENLRFKTCILPFCNYNSDSGRIRIRSAEKKES